MAPQRRRFFHCKQEIETVEHTIHLNIKYIAINTLKAIMKQKTRGR
jgi:hypothetical protein